MINQHWKVSEGEQDGGKPMDLKCKRRSERKEARLIQNCVNMLYKVRDLGNFVCVQLDTLI